MSGRSAVLLLLGLSGCASTRDAAPKDPFDQGYQLGTADAVKRLYWARQGLEAAPRCAPAGRVEYYTWEDTDAVGRAPATIAVPVFIPDPAPSAPALP